MQFSCDRTGFPLLRFPSLHMEVHLFPVAKSQFERFLAEPTGFGDGWYDSLLEVNPRIPHHRLADDNRERMLLTGIHPEEALAFAHWLGNGFDLPTLAEWRTLYITFEQSRYQIAPALMSIADRISAPAKALIRKLPRRSLLDYSLMTGGLVEWVRDGAEWVGLGSPRPEFFPNLWRPLTDVWRPIRPGDRVQYVGFRLVRRGV